MTTDADRIALLTEHVDKLLKIADARGKMLDEKDAKIAQLQAQVEGYVVLVADLRTQVGQWQATAAELEKEQAAEVTEFNTGYDAAQAGVPINDEPSGLRFDVWRIGWVWGKWNAEFEG